MRVGADDHNFLDVQRTRKIAIAELESKSFTHAHTLAKEQAETEEMKDAIEALTQQKEEHLGRRDSLKADIAAIQGTVKQRREAQAAHQRALEAQARRNMSELRFWEQCLGLRIEASGLGIDDQLRFVFLCIDPKNEAKEHWFELQMGGQEYEVADAKPKLDKELLEEVVEQLNESRDLGWFLKAMRVMFVDTLKG